MSRNGSDLARANRMMSMNPAPMVRLVPIMMSMARLRRKLETVRR